MLKTFSCLLAVASVVLAGVTARADEFTKEDLKKWDTAFQTVVKDGERLFHSALGKNNVSCDMCHPNASNNHPETYPKFQKQIGKVVGLRDMINWCIQNPQEGLPLARRSRCRNRSSRYPLALASPAVPVEGGSR